MNQHNRFIPSPAATWLWFLERDFGGVALDASTDSGPLASELSRQFSQVLVLRDSRAAIDEVKAYAARVGDRPHSLALGSLGAPPWNENTFDCIAVHDKFVGHDPRNPETTEELIGLRRLLKPNGWLVAASPNPSFLRKRSSAAAGISPGVFSRLLVQAQFRDVRRMFITPSLGNPRTCIPDAPRAVRAFEASDAIQGTTKWTRRALAALGVHAALYQAYVIMARA